MLEPDREADVYLARLDPVANRTDSHETTRAEAVNGLDGCLVGHASREHRSTAIVVWAIHLNVAHDNILDDLGIHARLGKSCFEGGRQELINSVSAHRISKK